MEYLVSTGLLFITALSAYFVYYKTRAANISKERLEKVYAPIFIILENVFFKYGSSKTDELFSSAFEIIKKNMPFAKWKTLNLFYSFKHNKSEVTFNKLSENIIL